MIRRVDHLNVLLSDPRPAFTALTRDLGFVAESPSVASMPGWDMGKVTAGELSLELLRYAPGRKLPAPLDSGAFAIELEAEPITETVAELTRRGIPHSAVTPWLGPWPPELQSRFFPGTSATQTRAPFLSTIVLGGFFGDESSARQLASRFAGGESLVGRLGARAVGRAGVSKRLGAAVMSKVLPGVPHVIAMQWHGFDVAGGRQAAEDDLEVRGGGPLGLIAQTEIIIGASDPSAEVARWAGLLAPREADGAGLFVLDGGPAIRIVAARTDCIEELAWRVRALDVAAAHLKRVDLLGSRDDTSVSLRPGLLRQTRVRLVADSVSV